MYPCKHCGQLFETKQKLAGHSTFCKLNPKYQEHLKQLEEARSHIDHSISHLLRKTDEVIECSYCHKIVNSGYIKRHERYCKKNPHHLDRAASANSNYVVWNKGLTEETSESVRKGSEKRRQRIASKDLVIEGHPHTEETKRLLSEKRKRWIEQHRSEFRPWSRETTKFKTAPCESLKRFLKEKGINFIEEYQPFEDRYFVIDIAFPDEKIAIEVNGNMHYNADGTLKEYYQNRHNIFEERGWKVFEIHFSKCYNPNIEDFQDILNLPIYDKEYVGQYMSRTEKIREKRELKVQEAIELLGRKPKLNHLGDIVKDDRYLIRMRKKELKNEVLYSNRRNIMIDLVQNSGIDFSKGKWTQKAKKYLEDKGQLFDGCIHRSFLRYYPEFFQRKDVWQRKGSIISIDANGSVKRSG